MPRAGAWAPLTVGYRAALGNAQPERQGYLEGPSPVPFHVAFLEPAYKTVPLICTSRHWMKCFQRITSLILTTTHFTGEKTEAQKIQGKLNLPSWQNPKTFSFLKSMLEPGLPTPSVVLSLPLSGGTGPRRWHQPSPRLPPIPSLPTPINYALSFNSELKATFLKLSDPHYLHL